jgi:hypothetical protein
VFGVDVEDVAEEFGGVFVFFLGEADGAEIVVGFGTGVVEGDGAKHAVHAVLEVVHRKEHRTHRNEGVGVVGVEFELCDEINAGCVGSLFGESTLGEPVTRACECGVFAEGLVEEVGGVGEFRAVVGNLPEVEEGGCRIGVEFENSIELLFGGIEAACFDEEEAEVGDDVDGAGVLAYFGQEVLVGLLGVTGCPVCLGDAVVYLGVGRFEFGGFSPIARA